MPRDLELYDTDIEYYVDPYGPLDNDDDWDEETLEYLTEIYYEPSYGDKDDGDLTEAQYQDRSWDEYDGGVFSEDLQDD